MKVGPSVLSFIVFTALIDGILSIKPIENSRTLRGGATRTLLIFFKF